MKNGQWMALIAVAAFGLAACGGDAGGSEGVDEMVEGANEVAEGAADAVNEAADAASDAAHEMADDVKDAMSQELPAGVTTAMIEHGKTVYEGAGICSSCHGPAGAGIPNLGADLTDSEWVHSDGSYAAIVETITNGVTADESSSGVPMPAKGGTTISEDDVKATAAYVWSLSK